MIISTTYCPNLVRVSDLFLRAIRQSAVPSQVRSDQGIENHLVAVHMLECRGHNQDSMITGSSVHNQWIGCIWHDMHHCVTSIYYWLFYYLEYQNYLNLGNNFHCYALLFILFTPLSTNHYKCSKRVGITMEFEQKTTCHLTSCLWVGLCSFRGEGKPFCTHRGIILSKLQSIESSCRKL